MKTKTGFKQKHFKNTGEVLFTNLIILFTMVVFQSIELVSSVKIIFTLTRSWRVSQDHMGYSKALTKSCRRSKLELISEEIEQQSMCLSAVECEQPETLEAESPCSQETLDNFDISWASKLSCASGDLVYDIGNGTVKPNSFWLWKKSITMMKIKMKVLKVEYYQHWFW